MSQTQEKVTQKIESASDENLPVSAEPNAPAEKGKEFLDLAKNKVELVVLCGDLGPGIFDLKLVVLSVTMSLFLCLFDGDDWRNSNGDGMRDLLFRGCF